MTHINKEKWDKIPNYVFTTEDGVDIYERKHHSGSYENSFFELNSKNSMLVSMVPDRSEFVLKEGAKFFSSKIACMEYYRNEYKNNKTFPFEL